MNDHAQRTSLSEDSDSLSEEQPRANKRWARDQDGGTDLHSRPGVAVEDSDVVTAPAPLPALGEPASHGASITRTDIGSLRTILSEDDTDAGALIASRPMVHGEEETGRARPRAGDDAQLLWLTFERSLGKPLDRPERLRIDLSLSSIELTTLRKIMSWLRQIDAVQGAVGLAPAPHDSSAMLIPVERGRVVLIPSLLAHLHNIARWDESDALTLVRWLCALARHHRALPWELVQQDIGPFPATAPRISMLELLLACRPERAASDDPANRFAAQLVDLAEETWLFARTPGEHIAGLLYCDRPSRYALPEVYALASICSSWLGGSAQLGLLDEAPAVWFAVDGDAIWFSVAGPAAVSLQRASQRQLGRFLSRLSVLEGQP